MPNTKSAKKELRQSGKRNKRNQAVKDNAKKLIKQSRRLIEAKDGQAKAIMIRAIKSLDKAAQKGIIKKNTASRKKSRLMKKFNQIHKT